MRINPMNRNLTVSLVVAASLVYAVLMPVSEAAAAHPPRYASPLWGPGPVVSEQQPKSFLTRLSQGIANAIRLPEASR